MVWIDRLLRDSTDSPPPTSPLPPPPGPRPALLPQTFNNVEGMLGGGYGVWSSAAVAPGLQQQTPLMAGLYGSPPVQLFGQAVQWNAAPVTHSSPNMVARLRPTGIVDGRLVYSMVPVARQVQPVSKSNRKRTRQEHDDTPRVKRPLNAFMVYLREQRATIRGKDSAAVNTILGDRWRQLSEEQQAPYYDRARLEAKLHEQQHTDWSPSVNYGTKKNRQRKREQEVPRSPETTVLPDSWIETPGLSESVVLTPSISPSSVSPHFDGQNYSFEDIDQLLSFVESDLVVETPAVSDCSLETPRVPEFTIETPGTPKSGIPSPCCLQWSPSTYYELQTYSCDCVDHLLSLIDG